jgi:hypothetical protein
MYVDMYSFSLMRKLAISVMSVTIDGTPFHDCKELDY